MVRVFRDGYVHVLDRQCDTCIFRPGNLMRLRKGRVKEMVEGATRNDSCIPCHSTLYSGQEAVCRGFFDRYAVNGKGKLVASRLQIADRLGFIRWQEPPHE
jgi:hypothetical protein